MLDKKLKGGIMKLMDDFKIRVIFKVDITLLYHFFRELVGTLLLSVLVGFGFKLFLYDEIAMLFGLSFGSSAMFGFNCAWEWQDGLRNDGANVADWLAGNVGILVVLFGMLYLIG